MRRCSLAEIARLAGVNPSTVSRALNPATASLISEEQRRKIVELCDRLSYRPQAAARSLAVGKTFAIGCISGQLAFDMSSPYYSACLAALSTELQRHGYSLIMIPVEPENRKFQGGVRDVLLSDRADGYILGAGLLKEQTTEMFRCTKRPIITLAYHNTPSTGGFPAVEISIDQAIREIWRAMPAKLLGEAFAFFGTRDGSSLSKLAKIREQAPDGIEVAELLFPKGSRYNVLDYLQAERAVAEMWPALAERKVIWCATDLTAFALIDAMRRRGLKPGRDIMVIGYDHIESVVPGSPSGLATIDPGWERCGTVLAREMLKFIASPGAPRRSVVLPARFVPGPSFPFSIESEVK